MKIITRIALFILISCNFFIAGSCNAGTLRVVIIRHAEKPDNGNNLNCQGLNRSLQLPKILSAKFGMPSAIFIPAVESGDKTKNARMFQTISPFAIKNNLAINSAYHEEDYAGVAKDAMNRNGTVMMVWQHTGIPNIVKALGVNIKKRDLIWPDNDYDSIWIITIKKGVATLVKDKEGLSPQAGCPF